MLDLFADAGGNVVDTATDTIEENMNTSKAAWRANLPNAASSIVEGLAVRKGRS
jgi:hypothetical protein